ncbi:MAG TPA: hypothetical protein VF100_07785, partial [Thermoanaerobaculia bacterium]
MSRGRPHDAARPRRAGARPDGARPAARARSAGGLLVFAVALALRLLFWQATPDRAAPGSAAYAGDAATWMAHAESLASGRRAGAGRFGASQPFELGLPLR